MRRPHRLRALVAGLLACALVVSSCASEDETPGGVSGGNGNAPSQATEATTPLPSEAGTATPAATGEPEIVALDACSLVTRDEAASALGEPVGEGEPSLVGDVETCTYAPESGGSIGSVQVAYLTRTVDASEFPDVITEAAEADLEPVPGIGDEAFWDGDQVVVLVGDAALSAIVIPPSDATTSAADRDASTELATLAAGRVR